MLRVRCLLAILALTAAAVVAPPVGGAAAATMPTNVELP
jgi:hypothetical protein